MKDVLARARGVFTLDNDGNPVAKDSEGKVILGADGVKPLAVKEWSHSLVEEAPYLFEGSSGGGANGSDGSDNHSNDATIINSDDQDGINNSIEAIAKGEVKLTPLVQQA